MASRYLEPEIERRSRAAMTRWQTARLREQVRHAAAHSPLYRRKFKAATVKPAQIRTLDDLRRLPFTTKDELKENQANRPPWGDVLAVPLADVMRVHLTSATTGRPLAFLVGGLSTDQRIDALLSYPITVLGCTPSYALFLAEAAAKKGVDLAKDTKVRITWHTGEPGACIPATRARIEAGFGARAYDLPGLTEIAAWGFECEARSGLTHVNEDYCYPEVLDEQDRPVEPGARGELVFTSLYRKAMPLLRYRTRDIVQLADRR